MKKVLVVLLIAVLAIGFVFADSQISGSVKAQYKFDFEAETFGYGVKGSNAKLVWTWNSHTVGPYKNSSVPYATATVEVKLESEIGQNAAAGWTYPNYEVTPATGFALTITLKEAKIVGENWNVDLLKATLFGDYAKSAWDYTYKVEDSSIKQDKPYTFDNSNGGKKQGITVTYDDYSVGIATVVADGGYTLDASTQTKKIEFEGGSAQAAAIIGVAKNANEDASFTFSVSTKADYTISDVSVKAAFDGRYVAEEFNYDVAAQVAYKPAKLDFYYASVTTLPAGLAALDKYMSARVSVDLAKIAEDVPVTVFVGMKDILEKNDDRQIVAGAEYKGETIDAEASTVYNLSDKVFAIGGTVAAKKLVEGFGVEGGVAFLRGVEADYNTLAANAGINYTADKFTASATATIATSTDEDPIYGFVVAAKSDKLVENAKLFAELTLDANGAKFGYDFLTAMRSTTVVDDEDWTAPGKYLTLGCEIKF